MKEPCCFVSFCEFVFAFIEYDYYLCDAQLLIHIIFLT